MDYCSRLQIGGLSDLRWRNPIFACQDWVTQAISRAGELSPLLNLNRPLDSPLSILASLQPDKARAERLVLSHLCKLEFAPIYKSVDHEASRSRWVGQIQFLDLIAFSHL